MRPNKIKQMWRAGECATLGWLSVSHGFTAEVMARQGFDALCIDLQHGTAEMKDVGPLLQAISQTDTVPVVRVAWNEPATIMKALDLGAYGIIVPLVNNAEEAAMAVAACRYPPVGMRSSGPVRAIHYGGADYVAHANDEIVIMAMIETKEGLANLDAICATPGLDAVYIGQQHQGVRVELTGEQGCAQILVDDRLGTTDPPVVPPDDGDATATRTDDDGSLAHQRPDHGQRDHGARFG